MPTLAELQINVNSKPIEDSTKALNEFAIAAEKANKAKSGFNSGGSSGGQPVSVVPQGEPKRVEDLSAAIDKQVKKLKELEQQRKKITSSNLSATNPVEYERLNKIIDANIVKVQQQGNAVTQLANKQSQEAEKRKAAVEAELRVQERLVRAQESQDNVLSNAAARQKRQLDATIAGLDAQVKAQEKYNKTVETLNKQRALSGISGPESNTLSGAEYDTYIAKATQQRDAALAPKDNSAQLNSVQSKLDSYTATLGKAERAEVQYARAVKTLNEAQSLGLVTTEQYDSKLASFAAHRDAAVKAANDNTVAEQSFERQLRSVVTVYDPVQRAQDSYNASVKVLAEGLQSGKISAETFNKALTEQRLALEGVKSAQTNSVNVADDYNEALRAVLPYRKELENLELRQRALDSAKAAGKVTTPQQIQDYNDATAAIKRQTEEYNKRIQAGQNAGITFKQEQAALRGLPAQFTDIVVSLQGGQAPLTVLLQQGGQIKDMFGGIGPAIAATGKGLLSLINPVSVLVVGFGAVALAGFEASNEISKFNQATEQANGVSGIGASQYANLRDRLDETAGTARKASEALTALQGSGKVAGGLFFEVSEAAINLEKATGQAIAKTVDDFASLAKDPLDAAKRLDDQYKFLTASVIAQAEALIKQGDEQQAVTLLQDKLAKAVDESSKRMISRANGVASAWSKVKGIFAETADAAVNAFRAPSIEDQIEALEDSTEQRKKILSGEGTNSGFGINNVRGFFGIGEINPEDDPQIKLNEKRLLSLRLLQNEEDKRVAARARQERDRKQEVDDQFALSKGVDEVTKQSEKLRQKIKEVEQAHQRSVTKAKQSGSTISSEQEAQYKLVIDGYNKKIKDAEENEAKKARGPSSPADTRQVQEVKSNLAVITSEYDGYYKKITALREANVISDEAAYYAQKAILDAQAKATDDSYTKQISAIKALQGSKKNSESTNISLENQLTKAEAARIKAQQDIQTKQEQNTARFEGDLKKREQAITAYKNALEKQIEAEQSRGDRAVIGVGRGDRQRNLSQSLYENDLNFAQEQRELARSGLDRSDPVQYAENLKNLEAAHSRMVETIIANDKRIADANYDWTNGYTRAVENAQEDGMNFARSVEMGLTGAFESAGDALATFVTTGKLNFSDFARSVLSDLATIAAKQAAMGALGSLFSIAGAGISGYFGGGASSVGSTSAGYTAEYFPNLAAAKGAAFESSGTQFFAQGGAFTNSIVNTPTAFGMAGNKRGVMGEAGPEAIMPLTRTSGGNLGVRVTGGLGGGGTIVNVQVSVTEGQTTASSDGGGAWDGFGKDLGAFVDGRVRTIINKETRPGGSLKAQNS